MKMTGLAALMALIAVSGARADDAHVVHGLSCKTEGQVNAAIALIQRDVAPAAAAEMLNHEEVACVFRGQDLVHDGPSRHHWAKTASGRFADQI